MALITCHECKEQISSEAETCPRCGAKSKPKRAALNAIGGLVFVGIAAWFFFGGGLEKQAAKDMAKIEQQVAADSIAQYEISKRNGNVIETCVHAGMVAAAFIQAKDEANHKIWLNTQATDCKKAGMTM